MTELEEVPPEAWDGVLDDLGVADVYFRRAYLESAALLGQGRPVYLRAAAPRGSVVFPALVRDARNGYGDVGTPMGYGGPVAAGADPPVAAFFDEYERWCAERRVVATFVRFHPALANHTLAEGRWRLEHIGSAVAWRLGGRDADALAAHADGHHRRVLRKARRAELEVEIAHSPADLDEFVRLYEETMRRRDASPFYFFAEEYWRHLTGPLGPQLVRADARHGGELVASILCLASAPLLHYHLGASSEDGQALGANHLLFLETAAWASARGFDRFQLGGGVGGFEDSLYEFKRRFDPGGGLPAILGKAVHDPDAYRELAGVAEIDYDGYFPAYRRPS